MERELERNGKGRKRMEKELLAELKALRDNRGEEEDGGNGMGPFLARRSSLLDEGARPGAYTGWLWG